VRRAGPALHGRHRTMQREHPSLHRHALTFTARRCERSLLQP
jgi:hypothetical protein